MYKKRSRESNFVLRVTLIFEVVNINLNQHNMNSHTEV